MSKINPLTPENDNYSRFGQGLGIATRIVQDILDHYIPGSKLTTIVSPNHVVWSKLDNRQRKLVKNYHGNGYKDFDIPLVYKILRNVCGGAATNCEKLNIPHLPPPTSGWEKIPHSDHLTLSDDIERLRLLRNDSYGHRAQATMPEAEYRVKWQELKAVVNRMQKFLGKDYISALKTLEKYTLNEMQLDIKDELRQRSSRITHVTEDQIKALLAKVLESNRFETMQIHVSPLHKKKRLSIDQIYVPVVLLEELENTPRGLKLSGETGSSSSHKVVDNLHNIMYVGSAPARYIFLHGEAGRGKTVFCLNLLWHWCNVQQHVTSANNPNLTSWEIRSNMREFHFVFFLKLRHVSGSHASVVDMICHDVFGSNEDCHDTIRYVLSNKNYRCLIIVDGLDEWCTSSEIRQKLTCKHVPNVPNVSNCTVLFTSRPWKLEKVSDIIRGNDKVVEIQGFNSTEIKTVTENVLKHYFDMDSSKENFQDTVSDILKQFETIRLHPIIEVPLMATASVHLWHTNANVGKSTTSFYIALLRLLVKRAIDDETVDKNLIVTMKNIHFAETEPSTILSHVTILKDFLPVLCKLGEIAYEDLVSDKTHLVFDTEHIMEKIGEPALEFSLKTGLLSHSEAHDRYGSLKVNFFHKSMQEFLSTLHILYSNETSVQAFLCHITSVETVMEFQKVITFVIGLSPSEGTFVLRHIAKVANTDHDIRSYRETFCYKLHKKVNLLYKMQLGFLREIQQSEDETSQLEQHYNQIFDIFLNNDSDTNTVRMTCDLLISNKTKVISLFIDSQPNDREQGIEDTVIHDFIRQTETLQALHIDGYDYSRTLQDIPTLPAMTSLALFDCKITPSLLTSMENSLKKHANIRTLSLQYNKCEDSVLIGHRSLETILCCQSHRPHSTRFCNLLYNLPSCKHLSELHVSYMFDSIENSALAYALKFLSHLKVIGYWGSACLDMKDYEADYTIVKTVSTWRHLRELEFGKISLGERTLQLTNEMEQIEQVCLTAFSMSTDGWIQFIASLTGIQRQFNVELYKTDISNDCVKTISNPNFTVTYSDEDESRLYFTRKYPARF